MPTSACKHTRGVFYNSTPDIVVTLIRLVFRQVAEDDVTQCDLENARAAVDQKDVEFSQAAQDGDIKSKDHENARESV